MVGAVSGDWILAKGNGLSSNTKLTKDARGRIIEGKRGEEEKGGGKDKKRRRNSIYFVIKSCPKP